MGKQVYSDLILRTTKCYWCGKEFIATPMHKYKHNGNMFCRYNCYNAHLNEWEKKHLVKVKQEFAKEEQKEQDHATNTKRRFYDKQKRGNLRRGVVRYTANGEFVAYYKTQKAAAEAVGCTQSMLSHVLAGRRNLANGDILKFEEETD